MNKEVNSIRILEVDTTSCHNCGETFYEIRDSELSTCPHCKEELADACSIEGTKEIRIEVDSQTGKLVFEKELHQEIEKLKEIGNDLNNELFHERTENDKLKQEIEQLKKDYQELADATII